MNDTANNTQTLECLEREREQLRVMSALVDSHAQEFVSTIQRKRAHLENIGSLAPGVALARRCYDELGELYSGAEYRRVMVHIEGYQTALAGRRQRLAARIEGLRHRLATASSPGDESPAAEVRVVGDRWGNDVP